MSVAAICKEQVIMALQTHYRSEQACQQIADDLETVLKDPNYGPVLIRALVSWQKELAR